MGGSLTTTGLTVDSQATLLAYFTQGYQQIYGADIVITSDTPDGQLINLQIQAILDLQDLLLQLYNSFNPDFAIGTQLDQRCAINGIQRIGATFTQTGLTIIIGTSCTLYGLDQTAQTPYTVQDSSGNLYNIITTTIFSPGTTTNVPFQAAVAGLILASPNTITQQVTIVLGVTSLNNPSAPTTLGQNEETDGALRLRRQQSVAISSKGYYASMIATLLATTGVTYANVYENYTANPITIGSVTIAGHSMWIVVGGSATLEAIGTIINATRNAGCGMTISGLPTAKDYTVTEPTGVTQVMYWDDTASQNVFISFAGTSIDGVTAINQTAIIDSIVNNYVPKIYQELNITTLGTYVQQGDPNCYITNAGFTTGETQTAALSGMAASGTFEITYNGNNSTAINWDDPILTIQTKVQAITGLSAATVSGSIASQSLVFTIPFSVQSLLTVTANSLMTSIPAAITFAWNYDYTDTLLPDEPNYQFVMSADNISITPEL